MGKYYMEYVSLLYEICVFAISSMGKYYTAPMYIYNKIYKIESELRVGWVFTRLKMTP